MTLPDIGIKPYYADKWRAIYHGDCREILGGVTGVSAVVTDPPYELGFMGKSWDSRGVSFLPVTWSVIRSACLPGVPLLSFGGTRTQHRIACAIEDAGWEIRDMICWTYGSGFPKSLDIGKAIDKRGGGIDEVWKSFRQWLREQLEQSGIKQGFINDLLGNQMSGHYFSESQPTIPTWVNYNKLKGLLNLSDEWDGWVKERNPMWEEAEREVIGRHPSPAGSKGNTFPLGQECNITVPATPEAQLWNGYGTALKPAYEPIILAMNPLDKTFANNALVHGVAGLNIGECRVPLGGEDSPLGSAKRVFASNQYTEVKVYGDNKTTPPTGRFPANFLHDGSDEVLELFPQSKGQQGDVRGTEPSHTGDENTHCYGEYGRVPAAKRWDNNGSAARFFYCAKASRSERDAGLEGMADSVGGGMKGTEDKTLLTGSGNIRNNIMKNNHPTVKPLALMTYLCKLVRMPEHNLILDPFCGSGTTLLACGNLNIRSIGIDSDEKSCEIAAARCAADTVSRIQKREY